MNDVGNYLLRLEAIMTGAGITKASLHYDGTAFQMYPDFIFKNLTL